MKPLIQPEPLVERWFSSLLTDSHKLEMAGLGAFVLFGAKRHSSVSKVETRIGSIKRALRCFHVFGNDATPSSLFEIHYLLALAQYILDSRPLLIKDNKIWSLQTLRSLMLQSALLEHPHDGIEAATRGTSKPNVESVCLRLIKLRKSVTSAMMEHCLPSLLDTVHRRERAKTGLPADQLRQNGFKVDRSFGDRSMKAQMKAADKSGAKIALIVGEDEVEKGVVTIRDLRGEEGQEEIASGSIIANLEKRLR